VSPWSWLEAPLAYDGVARDLILLYKFGPSGGRPLLAGPLARILAACLIGSGIGTGVRVLTSVESGRGRRRARGFDAARRLALHASRRAGLPRPLRLVRRIDRGGPLSPHPIFALRRRASQRIGGRTVLLIDDVLTTGGTADTCARLLLAAGAAEIRVAVLARTPPPGLTCAAAGGRRTATLETP